jgi:uncharacterized protein (TIGR02145 family)
MKNRIPIALLLSAVCWSACKKEPKTPDVNGIDPVKQDSLPALRTIEIDDIGDDQAFAVCEITDEGSSPVTARGVCWSTDTAPNLSGSKTIDGKGKGRFTASLKPLKTGTTYYARAYATNRNGTAYGNTLQFSTTGVTMSVPLLSTRAISNLKWHSCITGGVIRSNGGSNITKRGVCFATRPGPTRSDNEEEAWGDSFQTLIFLKGSTTYYVRAFAINASGIGYGDEISFTTPPGTDRIESSTGAGVRFDGHDYKSIVVGNGQEWMAENLRSRRYANGDPIANLTDGQAWGSATGGAYTFYENDTTFADMGAYYNWHSVKDARNVCPAGWHVPTAGEWENLIDYLGGEWFAGNLLASRSGWDDEPGKDQIRFNAKAEGLRESNAGQFAGSGKLGAWWTPDPAPGNEARSIWLAGQKGGGPEIRMLDMHRNAGGSIRCLKN